MERWGLYMSACFHLMMYWPHLSEILHWRGASLYLYSTILSTSTKQSPSWKAHSSSACQKFPTFHRTQMFITMSTTILHWTSWIQSTPSHPTSLRSILILSSYLCKGLTSGTFLSEFKILYTFPTSTKHITCQAYLILLDFISIIKKVKRTNHEAAQCVIFSILPLLTFHYVQMFSSALLSNTLNLCSSITVKDQVSHPYKQVIL
jgi:hypothetical protein